MEWTKGSTERFIQMYEKKTVLWDVALPEYKNSITRLDALIEIAKEFGIDVCSVEKKITSVRSQYFRELNKIRKTESESATDEVYVPTWYGFKLLTFLNSSIELKNPVNTPDVQSKIFQEMHRQLTVQEDLNFNKGETLESETSDEPYVPEPETGWPKISRNRETKKVQIRSKKSTVTLSNQVQDAYKMIKSIQEKNSKKDIFNSYGEFVAESLRNLNDTRLQSWARHQINNILYTAETSAFSPVSTLSHLNPPAPSSPVPITSSFNSPDAIRRHSTRRVYNAS